MDILIAFLAFSATMIVLSTMATMVVEFIHKTTMQRRRDFVRMLTNYYEGAVKPLVGDAAKEGASNFVESIRRNPAFVGEESDSKRSKWTFLFDTAFENLTTPQFVEQLSRSDVGKDIRKSIEQGEEALIEQLAAEFERYGDAAHDYFTRRARVISLFVAMIIALVVNVDAIRLFQALSHDSELAQKVTSQIDPDEWEAKYLAIREVSQGDAQKLEEVLIESRKKIREDMKLLSTMSLPIGHSFYPWCSSNGEIIENQEVKNKPPIVTKSHVDSRCEPFIEKSGEDHFAALMTGSEFWLWVLKALLAGLLIGLGAPFWFKTYRFLADFVPGVNRGLKTETRENLHQQQNGMPSESAKPVWDLRAMKASDQKIDEVRVSSDFVDVLGKPLNQVRLNTIFMSASGTKIDKS